VIYFEIKHSVSTPATWLVRIWVVVVKKLQSSNFYTSFSYWLIREIRLFGVHSPFVPKMNGERWWRSFAYVRDTPAVPRRAIYYNVPWQVHHRRQGNTQYSWLVNRNDAASSLASVQRNRDCTRRTSLINAMKGYPSVSLIAARISSSL